jgi:predicted RNase H-like HicB family nuclease
VSAGLPHHSVARNDRGEGWVDCYFALLSARTKGESGVRALGGESLLDDVRKMRYFWNMNVKYPIILKKSEEGFAVGCPALPGCWSQGASEEEAIGNIKVAIKEYLEVVRESFGEEELREIEVAV